MKIIYAGYLSSPFIVQDKEYLESVCAVEAFDFSQVARTFYQVPLYLIRCFTEIVPAVWRNDISWIWFADYPAVPFILFSKLFGKKTVVNIGGAEVYPANELGYGYQMKRLRGAVARWVIRNADMNLVMSEPYRDMVLGLVKGAKCQVIPGCVDASLYTPDYKRKEDVAVTAYCDWNMAGIIKGIPVFLEAKERCKYPMEVIYNRSHKTMIDTFLTAKVYCQLSYTESFGMALLEAMACGCVPIVSDRHGLPELVGNTGIIVPYGDVDATVKAVEVAMNMGGNRARERAIEYSVGKRNRQLYILTNHILNQYDTD